MSRSAGCVELICGARGYSFTPGLPPPSLPDPGYLPYLLLPHHPIRSLCVDWEQPLLMRCDVGGTLSVTWGCARLASLDGRDAV